MTKAEAMKLRGGSFVRYRSPVSGLTWDMRVWRREGTRIDVHTCNGHPYINFGAAPPLTFYATTAEDWETR